MATALDKSVITCDMEGIVETFSDGAQVMFGYSREETIGKVRVSDFSPGEIVLQNLGGWLATAVKEGEWTGQTNFRRKNGELFGAQIRITPTFKNGVQIGFCGVTEELDQPVDVPIKGSTKFVKWLVVTRAPFLTAALTPCFIAIAYVAGVLDHGVNVLNAVLACLGVALLHLASNVYNDYFDYTSGTDAANTKYFTQFSGGSRSIFLGLIDLKGTLRVANTLALLAFLIGLYLTYTIGTGVLWIGFAGLALGYFYTAPPLRLVARHGLGEIVIGLAFGPLITLGVFYVATASTAPQLWASYATMAFLIGIPAGLLTSNILLINQIPDTEGDAATGKAHLVVTFGYRAAVWFYALFIGGSIGTTVYLGSVLGNPYLYGVAGITTVFAAWIISYMRKHLYARTLVKGNVATIQFQIGFSILFIVALLLG